MTIDIEWFHDCGGKKSCDTVLVRTETRYWPAGGSAYVNRGGRMEKFDDGSKPSGIAYVEVNGKRVGPETKFEGDTEAQVMAEMELWTVERAEFVKDALRAALLERFGPRESEKLPS